MSSRSARGRLTGGRSSLCTRLRLLVVGLWGAVLGPASARADEAAAKNGSITNVDLAVAFAPTIVFAGESRFTKVFVVDEGPQRFLRFGSVAGINQSKILRDNPNVIPMEYLRYSAAALAFPPSLLKALVVGLGAGGYPRLIRQTFPRARVEVVELDEMVLDVARRFFGLKEDPRLSVRIADGAQAFDDGRKWDLIFLDAYGDTDIPEALATPEFFARVNQALTAGGVAVANIGSADAQREAQTVRNFAGAFPHCVRLHTPESGNIITVGGAQLPKDLGAVITALDRKNRLPFPLTEMAARFKPCLQP